MQFGDFRLILIGYVPFLQFFLPQSYPKVFTGPEKGLRSAKFTFSI